MYCPSLQSSFISSTLELSDGEGEKEERSEGRRSEAEKAITFFIIQSHFPTSHVTPPTPSLFLALFFLNLSFPPWWWNLHNRGYMIGRLLCGHCDSWLTHSGWAATGDRTSKQSTFSFPLSLKNSTKICQVFEFTKISSLCKQCFSLNVLIVYYWCNMQKKQTKNSTCGNHRNNMYLLIISTLLGLSRVLESHQQSCCMFSFYF